MSSSSSGLTLCEPTELYNILTQCSKEPAVLVETYLVLFDARSTDEYFESHVILARLPKRNDQDQYRLPCGVHLPSCLHCIVYDGNTVSIMEETPAVHLANMLACSGSKNPVMVLKGGYERFSREYPFLLTQKIIYTALELQSLPRYPNEVIPLFLYLGDQSHVSNTSMNYDLKIHSHVNAGSELQMTYTGSIDELHCHVKDSQGQDLLSRFEEVYEFLENKRKKSDRVLVFGDLGISRAATLVIAYLMKRHKWSLKEAFIHVQKCRKHICPLQSFLEQLSQWETQIHGQHITDIIEL